MHRAAFPKACISDASKGPINRRPVATSRQHFVVATLQAWRTILLALILMVEDLAG